MNNLETIQQNQTIFFNLCQQSFKKNGLILITRNSNESQFCKLEISEIITGAFNTIIKLSFIGFCRYNGLKEIIHLQSLINKSINEIQYNDLYVENAIIQDEKIKENLILKKCSFNCVLKI